MFKLEMDDFRAIAHIDPDGTGSHPAVFDRRGSSVSTPKAVR
jgi:hypothetical protein